MLECIGRRSLHIASRLAHLVSSRKFQSLPPGSPPQLEAASWSSACIEHSKSIHPPRPPRSPFGAFSSRSRDSSLRLSFNKRTPPAPAP